MGERIPQYKRIPCPKCGNYAFSFTQINGFNANRKCDGCGCEWDPDSEGREVVGYRYDDAHHIYAESEELES